MRLPCMTHAMGLADITLGAGLNYELSDKAYSWTSAMVSDQFVGNIPYELSYNRYIAIVKPNTSTNFNATAKGWKGVWKNALSYSPSIAEIEKQTAERSTDANQAYTLALGDVYYKNGAITHLGEDLEPADANTPIGVVAYIGNNIWTESGTGSGYGGHALVMCLKTVGSQKGPTDHGTNMAWYTGGTPSDLPNDKFPNVQNSSLIINSYNSVAYGSGYTATLYLINSTNYTAARAARNYQELPAPSNKSTGWFLPSAGQAYAAILQLGNGPTSWALYNTFSNSATICKNINNALSMNNTNTNYTNYFQNVANCWEWTTTEWANLNAHSVSTANGAGNISITPEYYKTNSGGTVRPYLAF